MKKAFLVGSAFMVLSVLIYGSSGEMSSLAASFDPWRIRQNSLYLSGVIAYVFMSLSACLAVRSSLLNALTGGLDKAYGLHKWSAIIAVAFSLLHWLSEKAPQWAVSAGWVSHPGLLGDANLTAGQETLLAAGLMAAEWGLYFTIVLARGALLQKIPYHRFRYFHKAFSIIYLAIAFHMLTALFKTQWWGSPAAWMLVGVTLLGGCASCISLFGLIGKSRQCSAVIDDIERFDNGILEITLKTERIFNYRPGQFVFLTFSHSVEPHPYTVASYDRQNQTLRFAIKTLGDYTRELGERLQVGQCALIEGPYGSFKFGRADERQIWIAGGIGITPFLSQLDAQANSATPQGMIDLWYCVRSESDGVFPPNLRERCVKAGVTLHVVYADRRQKLTVDEIVATCGKEACEKVWFCGPGAFAKDLIRGLTRCGVKRLAFHYDRFLMR